jgi:hypothetical protein
MGTSDIIWSFTALRQNLADAGRVLLTDKRVVVPLRAVVLHEARLRGPVVPRGELLDGLALVVDRFELRGEPNRAVALALAHVQRLDPAVVARRDDALAVVADAHKAEDAVQLLHEVAAHVPVQLQQNLGVRARLRRGQPVLRLQSAEVVDLAVGAHRVLLLLVHDGLLAALGVHDGEPLVRQAEPLVAVVPRAIGAARAHARGELAHQLLAAVRQRA